MAARQPRIGTKGTSASACKKELQTIPSFFQNVLWLFGWTLPELVSYWNKILETIRLQREKVCVSSPFQTPLPSGLWGDTQNARRPKRKRAKGRCWGLNPYFKGLSMTTRPFTGLYLLEDTSEATGLPHPGRLELRVCLLASLFPLFLLLPLPPLSSAVVETEPRT